MATLACILNLHTYLLRAMSATYGHFTGLKLVAVPEVSATRGQSGGFVHVSGEMSKYFGRIVCESVGKRE